MDLLLQIWGGGCYLINKILFAVAQPRAEQIKRLLMIWAWAIYIVGVPAWVIILLGKQNWIAASIEAGGIPAMLLGLYNTIRAGQPVKCWISRVVSFCTYGALVFGLGFSYWHHGGIHTLAQFLELGVMFGFLMGSYLMAKQHIGGWCCFMLMNISMAALMLLQDKQVLMLQQLLSLGFVIYGFSHAYRAK